MHDSDGHRVDILLVEDNAADVLMTREAFDLHNVTNTVHVAEDGLAAVQCLKRGTPTSLPRLPGLIILDLNLPKMSGVEVLSEIKADPDLCKIPVVVLSTSRAEEDIAKSYRLHASCYIAKPVDFNAFTGVVAALSAFWFGVVTLPHVNS